MNCRNEEEIVFSRDYKVMKRFSITNMPEAKYFKLLYELFLNRGHVTKITLSALLNLQ